MWKRACVCAILAAVLPQVVTWAAYGDVISNVPTPPAVTETAKPAAAASKTAAAAPKSAAVSQPAAAAPKSVAVSQPAAAAPKSVAVSQPATAAPKSVAVSPAAAATPKAVTVAPATKPATTPVSVTPGPAAPPVKPEPVTPKPITPSPAVTAKPAPQVPVPAAPKPGLVPETKPASVPAPKVSTTAPKTARAKKTRRETKKPATQYKAVYEVGDSGWKVREAQRKLRLLGYEVEDQQGHFTKEMSRQLKKFQRHAKLKADGKLDEKTYEALGWGVFDKTGIQKIQARDILSTAARYKGVPYYFGGTTPRGFDCSGYVQYVFRQRGAQLTRTADTQFLEGMSLRKSQLKPGDLVFFSTYEAGASHVGIYAGNGQFWNATSSRGVMLCQLNDSYWGPRYYGADACWLLTGRLTLNRSVLKILNRPGLNT